MQRSRLMYSAACGLFVLSAAGSIVLTLVAGCPSMSPGGGNDNTTTNANDNASDNGNDNGADNENDNAPPSERAFVGAATCQACHADSHGDWAQTPHASALETLRAIGQHTNATCLPCHTVGFGLADGYVDEATTPALVGVQCENCHGAAGAHARNPSDAALRPRIDATLQSAQTCGVCHTDAHHPTYDEWSLSKHATALAGLRANNFARDECLECHSQDYRWAIEENAAVVPTLATAQLSIECATCHAPHGNQAQPANLRMGIADLCGQCHTAEESMIGDTPHHPQIETLRGTGGFAADGSALSVEHVHSTLAATGGAACAQCHVIQHEVAEPNDGDPNVTGHTFNPFDTMIVEHQAAQYTGCMMCHTAEAAADLRDDTQSEIAARLAALAPRFDSGSPTYIDPTTLSETDADRLATARFNYQYVNADGSRGVHNPAYARALLEVAEEIVAELGE